ncbi:MAG: methylenetetrahydrofolate dehydrogenase (NADP+) / methenyltetrahydrofolate cyclohydrolase [Parcubacteria bacterium C7867-004]|nr:MAG: methylenetetrahydrofolate dehydrogenase (NADP+) / methenyltetrahydrofolate cyclohydrolase [Parcubacteria bacterium C7867-004]
MIVDGRAITSEILARVRGKKTLTVRAVSVSPSPATESYLAIKASRAEDAGMELEVLQLLDSATTEEVIAAVREPGADAIIVQLPLPDGIDTQAVLDSIPLEKDADVLSRAAYARFENGEDGALLPPVVGAVREILERGGIEVPGKRAVVIGQGRLVGAPVALWLKQQGASVSVLTRESGDLAELKDADIIVSGAGVAGLIQPNHVRQGVALIDAGTSESSGAIVGDADPACAEVAALFTPVPGGVGPVAVACLFANAARLNHNPSEAL